ncbi:MAG TPA: hypothetical protein VLV18_11025 [Terriglobales bacterium]|nr:hypothetical protein [Terriglobales bacterium]
MKISSVVAIGIPVSLYVGVLSLGNILALSPQTVAVVRQNAWA